MGLPQLLDKIANLSLLRSLKLPRDALIDLERQRHLKLHWPKQLDHLCSTGRFRLLSEAWDMLFESWPDTLKTLQFQDYYSTTAFHNLLTCSKRAMAIQHLEISPSGSFGPWEDEVPLPSVLTGFPRLRSLITPACQTLHRTSAWFLNEGSQLEVMILSPSSSDSMINMIHVTNLGIYVENLPHLRRVEVPDVFVRYVEEAGGKAFEKLATILEERGKPDKTGSSGIFVLDN